MCGAWKLFNYRTPLVVQWLTPLPVQEVLVRELDPMCCREDPARPNK